MKNAGRVGQHSLFCDPVIRGFREHMVVLSTTIGLLAPRLQLGQHWSADNR